MVLHNNEKIILKALGIPPILMDSGNNANIRPNHRLYYLETILPIVNKIAYAFERYFGFKLDENVSGIPALQPELRDQASYYATLVNTGIMTPNEAREALRFEKSKDLIHQEFLQISQVQPQIPKKVGDQSRRHQARKNNDKRYDDKGFVRVYGFKRR